MKILSGKQLRPILVEKIKEGLKDVPLRFFLYSNKEDFASQAYLRSIKKMLLSFEIPFQEDFIDMKQGEEQNLLNFKEKSKGCSILLARPLHVSYESKFLSLIQSESDPDMLTEENRGKLFGGNLNYLTATSQSVRFLLEEYQIPLAGKKAIVLGRSTEVGYPCFQLLNKKDCATTLLHSKVDQKTICSFVKEADIIILATGKPNLIPRNCFNSNQVLIDCGYNPNGGDLGYTPVPGGVGSLTSYCLLLNALQLKKSK